MHRAIIATLRLFFGIPIQLTPVTMIWFASGNQADGATKNDCERNAAKWLLHSVHSQYSKRRFVVLEDALAANGSHILALTEHDLDYI